MFRLFTFILLSFMVLGLFAQSPVIRYLYDESSQTYTFELIHEPLTGKIVGENAHPGWEYYWEFGDGNYSTEKSPKHQFERGKKEGISSYQIDLYLTPFYSHKKPKAVSFRLFNPIAARNYITQGTKQLLFGESIHIATHPNEIVAGEEIQVMLTYNVPTPYQGATLLFFFNPNQEVDRIFDLNQKTIRTSHGEQLIKTSMGKLYQVVESSGDCKTFYLDGLKADYKDVWTVSLNPDQSGQEKRIFLTLLSNTTLPTGPVNFAAILIPKKGECGERLLFEVSKEIAPSHDPNQIYVSHPRLEYFLNQKDTLTYEVRFENTGKTDAQQVRIAIAVDENLIATSLMIEEHSPKASMLNHKVKLRGNDSTLSDSIVFTFTNVNLSGRLNPDPNAIRQGKIKYKLLTSGKNVKEIKSSATIQVGNPNTEPVKTRTMQTLQTYMRAGLRLGATPFWPGQTSSLGTQKGTPVNAALVYSQTPTEKGWGFEIEAGWSNLQFERTQNAPIILANPTLTDTRILFQSNVNISYVDVLFQGQYYFNRHVRIGIGAGPSLLINGKSQVNSQIEKENVVIDEVNKELGFGLFNLFSTVDAILAFPETDATYDLGLSRTLESYLGGVAFVDVGGGWVDKGIRGGIRLSFRWQNQLYNERNVKFIYPMMYVQWEFLHGVATP